MYKLNDSLLKVRGIGEKIGRKLAQHDLKTVQDLLFYLPLNYSDLSQIVTINQLQPENNYTVKAEVVNVNTYYKNRKKLTRATIADETGRTQCIWFNSRFIKQQLKIGKNYFFAGRYSNYRTFTQPKIELVKSETLHTGRLVPRYSQTLDIAQGKMRLILKEILTNLSIAEDYLSQKFQLLDIKNTFSQLHFPDEKELVVEARKRLAIEELLSLIKQSHHSKQNWENLQPVASLSSQTTNKQIFPDFLPFDLTDDQITAVKTIVNDLSQTHPMNRLLIGDVGSGKTVVAGIAVYHIMQAGFNCALVAPTQILAEQHWQTFHKIFPELKTQLLTAKTGKDSKISSSQPCLFIGTHAVINKFTQINPALVVFDEQHRFGVAQRAQALQENLNPAASDAGDSQTQPHILTMSATPIPRSYMLTIFSHLDVSLIKQFPFGEKNIKTFVVPKTKKQKALNWIASQLKDEVIEQVNTQPTKKPDKPLALIVCPFINQSDNPEFSKIPAAVETFNLLEKKLSGKLKIALLHGQQKPAEQEKNIKKLFNQQIDLLVSTSIVEVGVDLPQANIMLIEGADRFGMASLHQLRGRVGRQSQESYCLLSSSSSNAETNKRLQLFAKENDGLKLAELDLSNRGPGDLFGIKQHGLDDFMFADWHNLELINQAKAIFEKLEKNNQDWQPFFNKKVATKTVEN